MRLSLIRGRYAARLAATPEDVAAAQRLRHRVFRSRPDAAAPPCDDALDCDAFDARCEHVLVEDRRAGRLICCFRLMPLPSGDAARRSYSGQYYDLGGLSDIRGPVVEMGRFCVDPAHRNPHTLRLAWAAMTQFVEARGFELLFGCSSFDGNDAAPYEDTFALLRAQHLAPKRWLPRPKAANIFRFAKLLGRKKPEMKKALRMMPPLLRGYLSLGGWVSDFAVIDRDLNTLHVFTGVEVRGVPPYRLRQLRRA